MNDTQTEPHNVGMYDILAPADRSGDDVVVEDSPRRVRAVFNGETIAVSSRMKLVHETNHLPVYYFPETDVRMDLTTLTDRVVRSPVKGDAVYRDIRVGERVAEDAMWSYPASAVPDLAGLVAFRWDALNHWYEEDEEVFVHARDPYHRIDTVPSSRRVQVVLGGEIVADTVRSHFLYETRLPTRYYIPGDDVRADLLTDNALETACPYKGTARYHSVTVDGRLFENIIWTYRDPISECSKIGGLLCFFNERVDAILVDGQEVRKVRTPWSIDE